MIVSAIVAVGRNNVIGKGNDIPWYLPADLKYFKRTTIQHHVIMGRKTFESMDAALPGRTNIVLSRDVNYRAAGATVVPTLDAALDVAAAQCEVDGQEEIFVIGGSAIYAMALPGADRLYLTEVHADVEGDTYFPEFDRSAWREVSRRDVPAGDRDVYPCSILVLERR